MHDGTLWHAEDAFAFSSHQWHQLRSMKGFFDLGLDGARWRFAKEKATEHIRKLILKMHN